MEAVINRIRLSAGRKRHVATRIRRATIDPQTSAGNKGGTLRKQIHHRRRNLRLAPDACERHMIAKIADHLLHRWRIRIEAARSDPARRNRIHPYRRPLGGGSFGEIQHAGARRTAMAHAGHAAPHIRDDVHDRTTAALHGLRVALSRKQKSAHQIGIQHRLPAIRRNLLKRRRELTACIVYETVDAAVF